MRPRTGNFETRGGDLWGGRIGLGAFSDWAVFGFELSFGCARFWVKWYNCGCLWVDNGRMRRAHRATGTPRGRPSKPPFNFGQMIIVYYRLKD